MSTEDYNRRINEATKVITALKKDIKYRSDEANRGQTTYSIDAEIRGQFSDIEGIINDLQKIVNNYQQNPKDFNLNAKQVEKRKKQFDQIVADKNILKKTYDSFFQKKATQEINREAGQQSFKEKYDTNKMTAKQLADLKAKQQQDQDNAIDDLINTVRNIKDGNKGISNQLAEQDGLLNDLDRGMDDNMQNMGKTKRKMMKLLDKSSNCCLIATIIIEIAAIILILLLWK